MVGKFIEPIYNGEEGLFPGQMLFYFVSLSIGMILFEGGLTLHLKEIKGVFSAIIKLITIGSLITFVGAGITVHFLIGLSWQMSFLFAGLIIVTGPTVIAPILRNTPLNRNISTVLKWEGVLIDPIGALVAVLVFDFIISGDSTGEFSVHAIMSFLKIVAVGSAIGSLAAFILYQMLKRSLIPHYLMNVFSMALVVAAFVGSDLLVHESGLLTVVVMGMVLGNMEVPFYDEILNFKESLSVLLISILFILLAANINISDLELLMNWNSLILFGIIVFVLRPLSVYASTGNSQLLNREKAFISWVGPRGIVAAGIASLFGLRLVQEGFEGAEYITPLVFLIVLGTVILNATTARFVARLLGVTLKTSDGILIIGANTANRLIAKFLSENDRHVVLIDTNKENINKAKDANLIGIQANIYNDDLLDRLELLDMGYLMAMTASNDVNKYACDTLSANFGELGTFRLLNEDELKGDITDDAKEMALFSGTDDYINLLEVARDFPEWHEVQTQSFEEFSSVLNSVEAQVNSIPVFIKRTSGRLDIIPYSRNYSIDDGDSLIYLGKKLVQEEAA